MNVDELRLRALCRVRASQNASKNPCWHILFYFFIFVVLCVFFTCVVCMYVDLLSMYESLRQVVKLQVARTRGAERFSYFGSTAV